MADRSGDGTWLEGPPTAGARTVVPTSASYQGARLRMPERGPGSIGRFGRRFAAIFVDWTLCQLIAVAVLHARLGRGGVEGLKPLVVFVVENLLLVGTIGATVGHRLLSLRVVRLDGGLPGPLPAAVRTVLLALAIPALIWDRDGRGLHDKAAGTVLVKTR